MQNYVDPEKASVNFIKNVIVRQVVVIKFVYILIN
jgi:hypothetical protein